MENKTKNTQNNKIRETQTREVYFRGERGERRKIIIIMRIGFIGNEEMLEVISIEVEWLCVYL
jgi:hypothetical protein